MSEGIGNQPVPEENAGGGQPQQDQKTYEPQILP